MAGRGRQEKFDPWGSHYFALEINGREIAHFRECTGIKTSAEVYTIEEGGLNGQVHTRAGRSKWDNIVLKAGVNVSNELLRWRDEYLQDKFKTRMENSGSIIVKNLAGDELRRYNFVNAWPVGWEGPTLTAGSSELAIETLEIAHEGIYINSKPPKPDPPPQKEDPPEKLDLPPIQFEYDSAELTDEGRATVQQASKDMDKMEIEEIWLEGHTCTMGSFGYNQGLSADRADSVKAELEAQNKNRKVYTEGYGWKYPVASNSTKSGREANRRTDFYTSPFSARGRNTDAITPENKKYDPPWNHRD